MTENIGSLQFDVTINTESGEASIKALKDSLAEVARAATEEVKQQNAAIANTIAEYSKLGDAVTQQMNLSKQSFSQLTDAQIANQEMWLKASQVRGVILTQEQQEWLAMYEERRNKLKAELQEKIDRRTYNSSPSPKVDQQRPDDLVFYGQGDVIATLENAKRAYADLDQQTKSFIDDLVFLEVELKKTKDAQKAVNDSYSNGAINAEKYQELTTQLAAEEKRLSDEMDIATTQQKAYQSSLNVSSGYINAKKEALDKLKKTYNELSEAEIKDQNVGGKMAQEIQAITAEINSLSPGKVTQVKDEIVSAYSELRQLRDQLTKLSPGDDGYDELIEKATLLKNKIENVNKELKLSASNTAGIDAVASSARGAAAIFTTLQGAVGLFAGQSRNLDKTIASVTSALALLNGVQEIASLVSKNSALNMYLQAQMSRMFSASKEQEIVAVETSTAITGSEIAAKELNVATTTAQTVATEGLTIAEGAQAVATGAATTAMAGLNAMMAANPAGALLLLLTAVIGAITYFISSNDDATESQEKMNEAMQKSIELQQQLADIYATDYRQRVLLAERDLELSRARGASEEELYQKKLKVLKATREEIKSKLDNNGYIDISDDPEKLKQRLNTLEHETAGYKAEIRAKQDQLTADGKLHDNDEKRLKDAEKQEKIYESQFNWLKGVLESLDKVDSDIDALNAGKRKEEQGNALKSAVAYWQARVSLVQKGSKAELDAQEKLAAAQKALTLSNKNLTKGEAYKASADAIIAIDNAQKEYAKARIEDRKAEINAELDTVQVGSARELELKKEMLEQEAQLRKIAATNNGKASASIIKQIDADEKKQKTDLDKAYATQQIENQKSVINKNLANAKKGSKEELDLRLQLIRKDAEEEVIKANDNADKIAEINAKAAREQADLRKQYSKEEQQSLINQDTNALNTQLAAAEKGSEEELEIKKKLVDQKALQDVLSATFSITNEKELATKLREISAKLIADKEALDDAYIKSKLDKTLDSMDREAEIAKNANNKIISSPTSSNTAKYNAQKSNLQIDIDKYKKEIEEAKAEKSKLNGSTDDIDKKINDLKSKLRSAENASDNLTSEYRIKQLNKLAQDSAAISSSLSSLANALINSNPALAEVLNTLSRISDMASSGLSAIASFKSGPTGIVGGITSSLSFLGALFGGKDDAAYQKHLQEVEEFNTKMLTGEIDVNAQYRERLRLQAEINKLKIEGLKQEQALLQQQKNDIVKDYNTILQEIYKETYNAGYKDMPVWQLTAQVQDIQSLAGKSYDELEQLFMKGQLDGKAKELFESLQKIKEEGVDIDKQLQDLKDQSNQVFTGTTADSILDGIVDGFKSGLRSAADFADNFEDLMRGAVLNSLKYQTLEKPLQDWYAAFAADASDAQGLTQTDIAGLQQMYNDIINNAANQFQNLQAITGLNLSSGSGSNNSLTGAIKGMTEQQADLLAGQFGGLRMTALDQLNISTQSLQQLQRIEYNTSFIKEARDILKFFKLNGIKIQ